MIKFDRKVLKTIKHFTNNMNEPLRFYNGELQSFDPMSGKIHRHIPVKKINSDIYNGAVERLVEDGYLRIDIKYMGGFTFCITDKLILYRQFWWDSFSQKFWNGFWAGFASAIATAIVTAAISNLLGLWSIL